MGAFLLSKWYLDCASESGDVVIAYAARLQWRSITLHYASILVREPGKEPRVQTTMRASPEPSMTGDVITWSSEALGVTGTWTALGSSASETIFASPDGEVKWSCHQPRARVEVTVGERVVRGLGYAEHLELSIEPWRMPIDSLRWGRFVGEHGSLVWIDWRGSHSKQIVLLDGRPIDDAVVDDRSVVGHGMRLAIEEGSTLRAGAIGKTALALIPGLERFPVRILAVEEQKWFARATLERHDARDDGWVIHEVVRWPEARRESAPSGQFLGKLLYGALFAAILPALLVSWARATEDFVRAPAIHAPTAGIALSAVGALFMVAGWAALWRHGGGLPMNAFPPPRLVTRGVYALVAHPIYVGFAALCFGVSIATGSASGTWLVAPIVVLGAIALVLGYETHDLDARFGAERGAPLLGLPPSDDAKPSFARRGGAFVIALAPFLALAARGARLLDAGVFVFALAAPMLATTNRDLRAMVLRALFAMALVLPMHLVVPSLAPSLLATAALVAAPTWPLRALALAVAAPDLMRVSVPSAIATLVAFALAANAGAIWRGLRAVTERVANSWHETRVGPVRFINHGLWAWLASTGGILIIGTCVGPGHFTTVAVGAAGGLVGAGLWAQLIEGASGLSRPYGFYGGLLGICLAGLAAPLLGTPIWLLLGSVAVSAPYIQAMGRMRCLVQGCCHGSETTEAIGIRYRHPRSRVCRIAHLDNVPVHATPLYSILWNAVTMVVVARLWSLHAPLHFIGGLYFVLNGLGRFVEEAYRGEPQTPIYARLRLYQWVALLQILAGAIITAVGSSPGAPTPRFNAGAFAVAGIFGVIYWLGMGVDFPESNRRFSRLA